MQRSLYLGSDDFTGASLDSSSSFRVYQFNVQSSEVQLQGPNSQIFMV